MRGNCFNGVEKGSVYPVRCSPRRRSCANRIQNEIHCFAQILPVRGGGMTPIKQRVLRKANDDVRYVCRADRGPARFEFAVSNALLHETGQESLAMAQAFLDHSPSELKVCLKELMAACCAVDDVGSRAVLRHDSCENSFFGRPFLRSGGFGQDPRLRVKSLQPSHKKVLLPLPIQVDRGARQSGFFGDIVDRGAAVTELAKPLYGRNENLLCRVFGFFPSRHFHAPIMPRDSHLCEIRAPRKPSQLEKPSGLARRNRLYMPYRLPLWNTS